MIEFDEYDKYDLADIVFNEVPFVKDAFDEYVRDKEEINDDEKLYGFRNNESGYGF